MEIGSVGAGGSRISVGVHEAATIWASSAFGAPRHFADLITAIEVRDEVLERVATEVVRRDVREERLPSNRSQITTRRVNPAEVDPFAISAEALRTDSEYIANCACCSGAGVCACGGCAGGGRARCGGCGGSGQVLRQYKKSSRMVKCAVCNASGTVTCGGCGGSGSVTCTVCGGSGHQLAWLTYGQGSRWMVQIDPQSPVVVAHRQLGEARFLAPSELTAFSVVASEEANGPVTSEGYRGGGAPHALQAAMASLDPRLERVNRQQYLRLAIVRRDAKYEMCGTTGTLVLSGKNLVGARTAQTVGPISRRLYAWAGLSVGVAIMTSILVANLAESGPYFDRSNEVLVLIGLLALALATIATGGLLRAWRPGFRMGTIRRFEKYSGAAAVAGFILLPITGAVSHPSVREAEQTLAKGDVPRARLVVDALKETKGPTPEVRDADDAVLLAEAKGLTGDARLKVLDDVASHQGSHATEAAKAARKDRLTEIRRLIDAKTPDAAIAAMDRSFADKWKADPELAGERARAYDVAGTLCTDDPCRVAAANKAKAATPTPERLQRATDARSHLVSALAISEVAAGEPLLARLIRLRALSTTATKTLGIAGDDAELVDLARKGDAWAQAERAKVPLIGSAQPVAEELLGAVATAEEKVTWIGVDGARVYLSLDAQKLCRGLYVVGASADSRWIHGKTWTPERLLSQALGRPGSVKRPTPDTATVSRTYEGGIAVVTRWKGAELRELRIGDATP